MADVINIGSKVTTVNVSPVFDVYSRVIIHISDNEQVSVGDETGRTLEFDNPFGNEAMAQRILSSLNGFQYRPYDADGALLNPAAEIGDALETTTSYGGIYTRDRNFGRLMKADVSAPCDEEVDHEYKFESPQERKFKRDVGEVRASLIITNTMIQSEVEERQAQGEVLASRITQTANAITAEVTRATEAEGTLASQLSVQADQISAKVSATGGSHASFGWTLNNNSHTWYSGNQEVMKITASGLIVNGEVNAKSGTIGGFTIGQNALTYNDLNYGDTNKNYGAYIGQSGIQLGKNFKVDNAGNVSATNMVLSGTLTVGGTQITAARLGQGALAGYDWQNGSYGGTTPAQYSLGGAAGYYGGASGSSPPGNFYAGSFHAMSTLEVFGSGSLRCRGAFYLGGTNARWQTATIDGTTINYVGLPPQ